MRPYTHLGACLLVIALAPLSGCDEAIGGRPASGDSRSFDGPADVDSQALVTDAGGDADDAASAPSCGDGACNGRETFASCAADCKACSTSGSLTAFEKGLLELPPDSWYEAPDTKLQEVCVPDSVGVRGVVGCRAIVGAWSGGAFDSERNELMIWGGGHDDYHGNELYAFRLDSGSWERRTEPTTVPSGTTPRAFFNRDPLADGNPVSRHTYDGFEYLTGRGQLFGQGGARATDGSGTSVTWLFDVKTKRWTPRTPQPAGPGGPTLAAAYDPKSDRLLMRASESLHIYDLKADSWSTVGLGTPPYWPRYAQWGDKTAVIDPMRRLLWCVGAKNVFIWDIDANDHVTDEWVTTGGGAYSNKQKIGSRTDQLFESGGGDVYNASAPGIDYDSAADALVAWANSGGPLVLELESKVWRRMSGEGAPTSKTSGGTYGRWRYIARLNVFILVTSVADNVRFYKHTRCSGAD